MINECQLVGKGTYGRVYRASVDTNHCTRGIAVKWSSRTVSGKYDANYDYWLKKVQRELSIMRILNQTGHNKQTQESGSSNSRFFERTSVSLINVYLLNVLTENPNEKQMHMFQLLEFFPRNLEQFLFELEEKMQITNQIVHFIMHEVCHGLYHLHSLGIIHRDLSDDNILVSWDVNSPTSSRIVISDYGQARFLNETFSTTDSNATPEQIAEAYLKSFSNKRAMEPSEVQFTAPSNVGKIHYRPPEGLSPYRVVLEKKSNRQQ